MSLIQIKPVKQILPVKYSIFYLIRLPRFLTIGVLWNPLTQCQRVNFVWPGASQATSILR